MGQLGCYEQSINNYQSRLCNIAEEQRPQTYIYNGGGGKFSAVMVYRQCQITLLVLHYRGT
jgi:hypothetical protein